MREETLTTFIGKNYKSVKKLKIEHFEMKNRNFLKYFLFGYDLRYFCIGIVEEAFNVLEEDIIYLKEVNEILYDKNPFECILPFSKIDVSYIKGLYRDNNKQKEKRKQEKSEYIGTEKKIMTKNTVKISDIIKSLDGIKVENFQDILKKYDTNTQDIKKTESIFNEPKPY